jgi:hypothetical protein
MVISGARRPPVWACGVGLALVSSAVSGMLFLLAIDGHLSELFHIERRRCCVRGDRLRVARLPT